MADTPKLEPGSTDAERPLDLAGLAVPLRYDEGGVIRFKGSRVTLDSVFDLFESGAVPETVARAFPTVSLTDLYTAYAFILQHREAVVAYRREQRRRFRETMSVIEAVQGSSETFWAELRTRAAQPEPS